MVQPYAAFIGPSYTSLSRVADVEQSMNWFPELIESEGAKNRYALYPSPGLTSFGSSSLSPWRGSFELDGRAWGVIGHGVFEVASNGTLTLKGTVDTDANPATLCSNGDLGNQLFITSGGKGYILDLVTDAFTEIVGLSAVMGGYLDGFFIALGNDNTIRISDYGAGLTWDPTQFRARAAAGDRWTAMLVAHREIWLWGSKSYEVWYNAGTAPFPFQLIQGQVYQQGIVAPFSATVLGDTVGWMSSNELGYGQVFVGNQYVPERVSNHAIEFAFQEYQRQGLNISAVVGMAYQENGHTFYSLTFGGDIDQTWVFDQSIRQWHERGRWVQNAGEPAHFGSWQPQYHMLAFGKHLVGDRTSGHLYEMGTHLYSDVGDMPIRRVRRAPVMFNKKMNFEVLSLEFDMQVGVGLTSGQGSDPKLMLRRSWDGGNHYGNIHEMAVGKRGKFGTRVRKQRLGMGTDFVAEISATDPVPWCIVNCYIDALPCYY